MPDFLPARPLTVTVLCCSFFLCLAAALGAVLATPAQASASSSSSSSSSPPSSLTHSASAHSHASRSAAPTAAPSKPHSGRPFTGHNITSEFSAIESHLKSEFSNYVADIEGWNYAFEQLFSFIIVGSLPIRRAEPTTSLPRLGAPASVAPASALDYAVAAPAPDLARGSHPHSSSRLRRRHAAPGPAATGAAVV